MAKLTSYIPAISGGPFFVVFPAVALMDSALGKRHLRVLGALCAHSNLKGEVSQVSQARLAAMLALDVPLISRIISNPSHGRTTDRSGPGLAQLGYVKVMGQSASRTDLTSYQLLIPAYTAGVLVRPDGTKSEVGAYVSSKVSDAEHAARTAALFLKIAESQRKAGEKRRLAFIAENHEEGDEPHLLAQAAALAEAINAGAVQEYPPATPKVAAVSAWPAEALTSHVVRVGGDTYIRQDVLGDIAFFEDGGKLCVPEQVYAYFGIAYPSLEA